MNKSSGTGIDRTYAYLFYWAAILGSCTMGETAGDYFSFGLHWGYGWTSLILGAVLAVSLLIDSKLGKASEVRYWSKIVIMSTAGTAFADYITRTMALGYGNGSLFLTGLFILVYISRRVYRSRQLRKGVDPVLPYSNDSMATGAIPDTDVFYWMTIMITSTFGTTMGDFVADALGFGFGGGALFLGSLFVVLVFLDSRRNAASIAFYWSALITASTIGATTGDFLTKPDGLDLGYGYGSAIVIALAVMIFTIRKRLVSPETKSLA